MRMVGTLKVQLTLEQGEGLRGLYAGTVVNSHITFDSPKLY